MGKKEELEKYKLLLEEGIIEKAEYDRKIEELVMSDANEETETAGVAKATEESVIETTGARTKGKNKKLMVICSVVICVIVIVGIIVSANMPENWTLTQVYSNDDFTELNSEDYTATLVTKDVDMYEKEATVTINGVERTLSWSSTTDDSSILGEYGELATGVTDTNEGMIIKFFEKNGFEICVVGGFDDKMYMFQR